MNRVVVPPYDEYELSTFVEVGSIVHIGHFGGTRDESGELIESVEGQLHQTLDNLETAMSEIDLTLDHVAKLQVILDDIDDFGTMHDVWTERFSEDAYPARTVVTSDFVSDEILVQIEGIAGLEE